MRLAKPCIDIGLTTGPGAAMLDFWGDEAGLVYEGPLPIRRGHVQHRFRVGASVVKVNLRQNAPSPAPPSGYVELIIARPDLAAPLALRDPDGNAVSFWPQGEGGLGQMGVRLKVRDLARHRAFYRDALGLEETPSPWPGAAMFAAGETRLILEEDPAVAVDSGFEGPGWRYITFQVFQCDAAHAAVLAAGGREAMAPTTLGDTARISMITDPDGNWIELSQRRSLVGTLD